MRDGYRILDADRHVLEPMNLWREYLAPEFRDRAPYLALPEPRETPGERLARLGARGLIPPMPVLMLEGEPVIYKLSERAQLELSLEAQGRGAAINEGLSPEGHLRSMDRAGIDLAFLYPTYAAYLIGIDSMDPALAGALARAYNDWLKDFCQRDPERLRGVGLISLHDPAALEGELARIVGFGWRAVVLRPNPVKGRLLSDRAYDPFYRACAQLGVAVVLHEGTHTRLPTTGADRFESRFALHACSHPMEQMMALLALIEGGVLERHPTLRVAFLEAGCGWLPYWLWRLDEIEYKNLAGEVEEQVRQKPSAYFRRQGFISFEPDEPYLAEVLRHIGQDKLLFGTDFPHLDHSHDLLEQVLSLRGKLPEEALRGMLWDNAARLFGLG
jgi:uncharacterized protein